MSWEYSKYEAECKKCGKKGFCIKGSDDWNRSSTSWEGFESDDPAPTAVARKRVDRRDAVPICSCGSSEVVLGEFVGDA